MPFNSSSSAGSGSSRRCRPSCSAPIRRWFNAWALLVGWAVGTAVGTAMAAAVNFAPTYPLALGGFTFPGYSALYTLVLNLILAIVLTPVFNAVSRASADETVAADYHA